MYYGPQIILDTGITVGNLEKGDPRLGIILNIPLALTGACGSVIAMFIIDKVGRRYIMLRSLPLIIVCCLLVGLSFYLTLYCDDPSSIKAGNYLAMIGMLVYMLSYQIGWGSTPWVINSEIYPLHLIEVATSLSTSTNWISNFIMSTYFLQLLELNNLGHVLAFGLLAIFSTLAFFFVYYLVPETKGRTIVENVARFRGKPVLVVHGGEVPDDETFEELN